MRHHGEALRALTHDDALLTAMEKEPATAPLSKRQRALVDYAVQLTRFPQSVTERSLDVMRQTGLSDAAIHDAAAITGYFNFVNRLADGLGVELE